MNSAKKIIVTGGAGFIGSNYMNVIAPLYPNYTFIIVDSLTAAGNKKNIKGLSNPRITFIKADIRDRKVLQKIFTAHRITDVIHFAAESHVDRSITNPSIFLETNVLGTENLLKVALAHNIRRFHHISTDEVYGSLKATEPASSETSPLHPRNPYSASKAAAEHVVMAYANTYGLNTIITRCSNNYGPNQDHTKMIPLFISRLKEGKTVPVYGDGKNIRDWIYVDDHVHAIDLVFHKGTPGGIYNIGGHSEIRNIDVAKTLIRLVGGTIKKNIEYVPDRPGHDFRYALNTKKIEKEFGWKPKTSFAEGIEKTIQSFE